MTDGMLSPMIQELDEGLWRPTAPLMEDLASVPGDILVLGAGGKMGYSLARMAVEATHRGAGNRRVIAVSRFRDPAQRRRFEDVGIEVVAADLLQDVELEALPDAANVVYLAGRKFGTTDDAAHTWALNSYVPGRVALRYRESRIVALSTGNVYPLTPVVHGGAREEDATGPVGEYAQSCLGRERIFQYFSQTHNTPMVLLRLNYAIDLRYGVLHDIARAVLAGEAIDVSMASVNVIWQGDANAAILRALGLCKAPPRLLNLTGPETVSVRWLAQEFGRRFGVEAVIEGEESSDALIADAGRAIGRFGYPRVTLRSMIDWTVAWIEQGGPTLGKPTGFAERTGRF